jgi:trigger factor
MNRLRREVGEQLIAAYAHVEMPPRLVERRPAAMAARPPSSRRPASRPARCAPEAEHEQFMEAARKRVLVGLLVGRGGAPQRPAARPQALNETLQLIASTYEEPSRSLNLYRNDPQLMTGLQNRVMEEQVIDWIAERAQHTEQALTFQEAIAPGRALARRRNRAGHS